MACDPLPYDRSCLPDAWPDDPEQTIEQLLAAMTPGQRSAYDFAAELLGSLTQHRYGLCERVARPCSARCALGAGYSRSAGGWFSPYLYAGRVYNSCGCGPQLACGCGDTRAAIVLAGPVESVSQVLVDGLVVPADAYRIDNATVLVRTDGDVWPLVQDLNAPATEDNTFQVTYRQGLPLPAGGQRALSVLMLELFKARCGDASCRLPSRVTSVVREGVTYSMLDDPTALLDAGRIGIADVDMWLASINPHGTRTRMAVYSPDLPRRR